ncbi:hypothetical protein quinque_004385 [Culex quinquefasciatus]
MRLRHHRASCTSSASSSSTTSSDDKPRASFGQALAAMASLRRLSQRGCCSSSVQVQPVLIRKTPKFPSRERHLAIRRKKSSPGTKTVTLSGGGRGLAMATGGCRCSSGGRTDKVADDGDNG